MKKLLRNESLIIYYIIQLLILGLCFLVFTSTIEYFPWYEPLTFGAFIGVMILTPIQASLSFLIGNFRKKLLINKNIYFISKFNTGITIFTIVITIIKESLFYPFSKVFGVVECLLILYFLFAIIKPFIKTRK
ncbi:hypothetical protein [Clostridium tertium]|uniref:hypothetical protein n=1 Tax=Clostridium tertium TaxID=1559 RepID=UPI000C06A379|nr:hypothetical protein [Clostridium tertium]